MIVKNRACAKRVNLGGDQNQALDPKKTQTRLNYLRLLFADLEATRRFLRELFLGLPSLWSTSLPSPLLTAPEAISFARAALRLALFFFWAGLL